MFGIVSGNWKGLTRKQWSNCSGNYFKNPFLTNVFLKNYWGKELKIIGVIVTAIPTLKRRWQKWEIFRIHWVARVSIMGICTVGKPNRNSQPAATSIEGSKPSCRVQRTDQVSLTTDSRQMEKCLRNVGEWRGSSAAMCRATSATATSCLW